ncbi:MAG: prephenate dehydrogenase/arogenate dehydrogenase family protein [Gammaproteobacteria bacterium]|nr:MAG: prephenate dehydrogenase/arogenate dehydrogenase family protein [Gammaproteobacteria bacterium]RLA61549.1 MAG: prephenate dehydrogenase/arogenate dehydrogenase family protein [Gammaproteobacteria bacterium]
MSYPSNTVVILGLGLIGGSLARALRDSGFSRRFIGYEHRESSLRRGMELGVIDDFTLDLDEAIEQADIMVVCTPTLIASDMLRQILSRLAGRTGGPVITDVASVKGNILCAAQQAWEGRMPPQLVLGHPIAGSERSGVDASNADLFVDHRVILTPVEGNDPAAVALIRAMWESVGAEVVDMTVTAHDAVLAATSHLPHVLAYTLVDALAQSDASDDIFRFAAGGFRDFTRIASSDPAMWRDIAIANRVALLDSIDTFSEHLGRLRNAVATANAEQLFDTFSRAKQARDEFSSILAQRSKQKP